MLKDGLSVLLPIQKSVIDQLDNFANDWISIPMLARTHGQTASPTTVGKEFAVFSDRLEDSMSKHQILSF